MKQSKNILTEHEKELVQLLMADCQSTGDIQRKLKRLFAGTIEQMLECEMEEHLGYEKHSVSGNNSGNSRNGYNHKTIVSDYGESEVAVPRDRNGDIEDNLREIYGCEISQVLISKITDKILPEVNEWQNCLCGGTTVRNDISYHIFRWNYV